MFENIHFMTDVNLSDFRESDLLSVKRQDAAYQKLLEESPDGLKATDAEYQIQGDVQALLEIPMAESRRSRLMYIQSFSCMNMSPSYFTHRKNYASYLILYTYGGEGRLEYEGRAYPLRESEGFLIDCRREHTYYTTGASWYHSDLHFFGGLSEFIYEDVFRERGPIFRETVSGGYQTSLEKLLTYHTSAVPGRELLVSTELEHIFMVIMQLMTEGERNQQSGRQQTPEAIQYLRQYLEHNFAQEITLDSMADFCGMSKYHLVRQFKRYTSFTPKEYLLNLRISHAKMLLMDSDIPAYKVGMMVGMENEANFIRTFKQRVGVTPGEYRRQMRI